MSTLSLEGTLLDNTGVLQCATTGAIVGYASRNSIPLNASGQALCVAEASQARTWLNGLARANTTGYLIVDASTAPSVVLAGWPLTSTGAVSVDTSGGGSGNFTAGLSYTTGGKIRATGLT